MMETASDFEAMSPGQLDEEKHFITTYGVMTAEEFTEFTDNRRSFKQNILNGKLTKEELLVQITLESIILDTCEQKIELIMREDFIVDFHSDIETILSNRIHNMYMLLFKMFKYDVKFVSKYILFCMKNEKLTTNYKIVLDDIMNTFQHDPEVYIHGAHHAFNDCNDIVSARRYISTGIKYHEDFKKLYVEDFWIEVKNLNQEESNSVPIALKKYKNTIEHFRDDISLHFDLVDIALDDHIKMTDLQCVVVRDMLNNYRKNEFMWQKLARIHLNGFVYNYDTGILQKIQSVKQYVCIRNCIDTYEKATKEDLSPKNKQHLWEFFLDDIIDIHSTIHWDDEVNKDYINKSIDRAFTVAYSTKNMNQPRHFVFWAEHHDDEHIGAVVLQKGLTIVNNNLEMWSKLYEYYIHNDFLRHAMAVLFESYKRFKSESLPLWETMELFLMNTDEELIENFYKQCSFGLNDGVINTKFRPAYLEWRILTYDIVSGRQLFNNLKYLEPKSCELYKKMLQFETIGIVSNECKHIKYVRKLLDEACKLFGHMDVEIWYDCMRFEYMYGTISLVDMIFEAGVSLLEKPSLKKELTEKKYELDEQFIKRETLPFEDETSINIVYLPN